MADHIDHAVAVLNEALATDPDCVRQLLAAEAECSDALAVHPSIQVGPSLLAEGPMQDRPYVLRPFGLINGLLGVRRSGYGHIAMICDGPAHDYTITGFQRVFDDSDPEDEARVVDQPADGDTVEGEALVWACAGQCGNPATHAAQVMTAGGVDLVVALCDDCEERLTE